MDAAIVGNKIAESRKKKNLTQTQLGEKLGVSNRTVSKWEKGNGYPDITILPALAKTLEISIDALLSEDGTGEAGPKNEERSRGSISPSLYLILAYVFTAVGSLIIFLAELINLHYRPFSPQEVIVLLVGVLPLGTGAALYFIGKSKYEYRYSELPEKAFVAFLLYWPVFLIGPMLFAYNLFDALDFKEIIPYPASFILQLLCFFGPILLYCVFVGIRISKRRKNKTGSSRKIVR